VAPAMQAFYGLPFERFEKYTPYGTAADVAEFLATYVEAGCTEFNLVAQGPDEESTVAAVARLETRMYLGSQLLRDIDAMSMAHGLEVRVPFVDHELLDCVWPELGTHPHLMPGKRLLVETLDKPLPPSIVGRRKQGFTLPMARWMTTTLRPVVTEGLELLARDGWLAAAAPSKVWTDWQLGAAHWTRPWGLAVLGHFLNR